MKIAIIGAGIAGLTAAVALKRKGFTPIVFESSEELKAVGAGLGLAANAIKAFQTIGLKDKLIERGQLLASFTIYDRHGKVITKTSSLEMGEVHQFDNFAIHRAELQSFLVEQFYPERIHTGKKLNSIYQEDEKVLISFTDGTLYKADFVIAADGIHSAIRKQLLPDSQIRYAGYTCWRAVVKNTLKLNFPSSSEIWGAQGRFGIVPLKDNTIYWFACLNSSQNDAKVKNMKVEDLLLQFKGYPDDVINLLSKTTDKDLLQNDIIDLKPIKQFAFGRVLLIGDAAHATTPNMGQGACQAIEDAVWLAHAINEKADLKEVFKSFEKSRIKRVHWITDTSWKIGKAAQVSNPILAGLRNHLFRNMPTAFRKKQLNKLSEVHFPTSSIDKKLTIVA